MDCVSTSQSNDVYRGTTELVQHFRLWGYLTSAREHCLAISLAHPRREGGGILLVKMISTCLRGAYMKRGGGGQHSVVRTAWTVCSQAESANCNVCLK
jgi:hypothetical protein